MRRFRPRLPYRTPLRHRITATQVLVAFGLVVGVAGVVLLTRHHGSGSPVAVTSSTSRNFGGIPGAGGGGGETSTTNASTPLGIGAFCSGLDDLTQNTGSAQYYLSVDDLSGLRSVYTALGPTVDQLMHRAPADIFVAMQQVNTDVQNLTQQVMTATNIDDLKTAIGNQIGGVIQRNAAALKWVTDNCPQAPAGTTTSTLVAP